VRILGKLNRYAKIIS